LLVPRLAPDFTGIGPLGFTLTKTNWLDRHATGALTYDTYRLEELHPRAHGDTAVVTAHQITEGTYQGHPLPSQLRVTLELPLESWRLLHYGWVRLWWASVRFVAVVSVSMSSAMMITSWQQGQAPPGPKRRHGSAQSGHHCSAR